MQITGKIFGSGPALGLTIEDGRFSRIEEIPEQACPAIAPGLVDAQINGFGGVDFSKAASLTADDFRKAAADLWKEGCTAFLPTIITNDAAFIEQRFTELAAILDKNPDLAAAAPGFHLEGPFISPEDGARGAHPRQFVRAPDLDLFRRWYRASGERIRIVTVAPEWEGSADFIRSLVSMGIVVSIGHSLANPEQVRSAVRAGASMVTHFANGIPLQVRRHPNILWEELAQDNLTVSLIADGFHLPSAVLKTAFRVKGSAAVIVSDSTNFGGLPPGDYTSHIGGRVTLSGAGRLFMTDNPDMLAGSAQSLFHGVSHVVREGLLSLEDAWRRGSEFPARLCGFTDRGKIAAGAWADFVEYESGGSGITIRKTWQRGSQVYPRLV